MKNHRVLQQSLEILEYISKNTDGNSFTDVVAYTKMPNSSAFVILETLKNLNYLQKDDKSGIYRVGIKTFEVGSRYVENLSMLKLSNIFLEKVSIKCNETCHVAILSGTDVVYIYKHESSQALRMASQVGKRLPAHATAVGKALLSCLSEKELHALYDHTALEKLTDKTAGDMQTLLIELKDIREKGFAYENEESTPGIKCFAIPIADKDGKIAFGISISIPTSRVNEDITFYTDILFETKRAIETFAI